MSMISEGEDQARGQKPKPGNGIRRCSAHRKEGSLVTIVFGAVHVKSEGDRSAESGAQDKVRQ